MGKKDSRFPISLEGVWHVLTVGPPLFGWAGLFMLRTVLDERAPKLSAALDTGIDASRQLYWDAREWLVGENPYEQYDPLEMPHPSRSEKGDADRTE